MISLLIVGYVIAAFIAGVVALMMPCCFSVLLPSYFAQSFKQKSRRIGMTIIFSLGIATIMLPITFGISFVGRILGTNHDLIFVLGGFLMILIGFWTLWGGGMLPRINFPVNLNKAPTVGSIYTLGMFSGAATTCCAPVLAGILVLSALTASLVEGLLIGFIYVIGMVFPLFLIALIWEKYHGTNFLQGKIVNLKLFGQEIHSVQSSKLIAGLMFLVMGPINIILGLTNTMIPAPGSYLVGAMQAELQKALLTTFSALSIEYSTLFGILALAFMVLLVGIIRHRHKRDIRDTAT